MKKKYTGKKDCSENHKETLASFSSIHNMQTGKERKCKNFVHFCILFNTLSVIKPALYA